MESQDMQDGSRSRDAVAGISVTEPAACIDPARKLPCAASAGTHFPGRRLTEHSLRFLSNLGSTTGVGV